MKKYITFVLIFIALIINAQIQETRNISSFDKISGSTGVNISYHLSNSPKIIVDTDKKENLNYIITEVKNNVLQLYIDNKEKRNINISKVNIAVYGSSINSIKMSSGAQIKFNDKMNSNGLEIHSSSGSITNLGELFNSKNINIHLSSGSQLKGNLSSENIIASISSGANWNTNLKSKQLEINSSSGSSTTLSGKTNLITVKSSSGSKCNLYDLEVLEANFKASSSATINSWVVDKFSASVSSSSKITIKGEPKVTSIKKDKSGKVKNKSGNDY
ncbi:GIN domain-containing protein [Chishuiella sp.]|uniref:GIN domain-containing protein n=1 Tax=Chishuiella sp. TaxID=1969467 RepID=UPI0028A8DB3B|nr:DUF2807 domain-containing protein [Chishuiella sp.]